MWSTCARSRSATRPAAPRQRPPTQRQLGLGPATYLVVNRNRPKLRHRRSRMQTVQRATAHSPSGTRSAFCTRIAVRDSRPIASDRCRCVGFAVGDCATRAADRSFDCRHTRSQYAGNGDQRGWMRAADRPPDVEQLHSHNPRSRFLGECALQFIAINSLGHVASSNVAAVSVAPRSATITWQTNKVSDQQAFYGTTSSYGMSTLLDPTQSLSHNQTLTDLLPETTYHFRVKSRDAGGSVAQSVDLTFVTPSEVLISALSPTGGTTRHPGSDQWQGFWIRVDRRHSNISGRCSPCGFLGTIVDHSFRPEWCNQRPRRGQGQPNTEQWSEFQD